MKSNKVMMRITGTAAVCAAIFISFAPVTAYANTGAEADCICDTKCSEGAVNDECPVCREDILLCQGTEETENASEAVSEETPAEEEMGPLTPDGNLDLVDDYGSSDKTGKQFITFTTKNGNYFYLIIDRDDSGNETVHFLNLVDESDLLSLMDDDEVKEYTNAGSTEEAASAAAAPAEPEPVEEPKAETKKSGSSNTGLLVLMVLVVGGGIGGYFYLKTTKSRKPVKAASDPDADYSENEEGEEEEDLMKTLPKAEDETDDGEDSGNPDPGNDRNDTGNSGAIHDEGAEPEDGSEKQ